MEKQADQKEEDGKEKEKKREKEGKSSSPQSSKRDPGMKKKTKLISDLFGDEQESKKSKKTTQVHSCLMMNEMSYLWLLNF